MPRITCLGCKKNFISILLIDVSIVSHIRTLPHILCGGHALFFPKYKPEDPSPPHRSRSRNDVFGCSRTYTPWIDGTEFFFHLCLCHWLSPNLSSRGNTHHSSPWPYTSWSYTRRSAWAFSSCRRRCMDCDLCSHPLWRSRDTCMICYQYYPGIEHISGYCYSSDTCLFVHHIDASWIRFPEKNPDNPDDTFCARSASGFCSFW